MTPPPEDDNEHHVYDDGKGTRIAIGKHHNDVHMTLPAITTVGLSGLHEVASYTINRIFGSTSHVVQFVNGGCARLSHTDQGELLEFDGCSVRIEIDQNGRVLVGALTSV